MKYSLPATITTIHPSFHLANLKLCTFEMVILHPSSQPLATICAFRLYDFNYSSTSLQWIQCIFACLLLLAYFRQYDVSKDLSYVAYIKSPSFLRLILHCMHALHFVYPFTCQSIATWVASTFGYCEKCSKRTWVYKSLFRFLILNISLRTELLEVHP